MSTKSITCALLTALSIASAGCGVAEQGRAPVVLRMESLQAGTGTGSGTPTVSGYLDSDVRRDNGSIFSDVGQVKLSIVLRDPGAPGLANAPSELNTVTITHYRVVYHRTDGRNVQGVDVPFAFDSGATFSVSSAGTTSGFEIVRASAKIEAPLLALAVNRQTLDVIADVTFYGKDMHNNDASVTGSIGITFANYGG